MLQKTEAVIKSQTEDSMKPKSRHQCGLFLALLIVAPRHGLQMPQEKAEYSQPSWVSQRNLHYLPWISVKFHASIPLGHPACTCMALYRDVLAKKIISLVSNPSLKMLLLTYSTILTLHCLLTVFLRLPALNGNV